MPLHDLFHYLSARTRQRLSTARKDGWELREESITENLLLALLEHDEMETMVFKATVKDESVYGPDWLWAISTQGVWFTMWVQAKKASGWTLLSYEGLSGTANQPP